MKKIYTGLKIICLIKPIQSALAGSWSNEECLNTQNDTGGCVRRIQ